MGKDHAYKYIENFRIGIQFYTIISNHFISIISFRLTNENKEIVSFNGQSFTTGEQINMFEIELFAITEG